MNQEQIKNKLRELVDTFLYDDLTPYLAGVRDCLNIIQDVDYISINESLEYIGQQVENRKKELEKEGINWGR